MSDKNIESRIDEVMGRVARNEIASPASTGVSRPKADQQASRRVTEPLVGKRHGGPGAGSPDTENPYDFVFD